MLGEALSWEIIDLFDWSQEGDDRAVMKQTIRRRAAMKVAEIKAFAERLAPDFVSAGHQGTGKHTGQNVYKDDAEYFEVILFSTPAAWVVAKGCELYTAVLADPKKIPKGSEFESLLYLADDAYMGAGQVASCL